MIKYQDTYITFNTHYISEYHPPQKIIPTLDALQHIKELRTLQILPYLATWSGQSFYS